jgi:hypothetical protein
MSETRISADKVRAYRATDYRLGHTTQDIVLAPGLRSDRLAALFASKSVTCGAFLTAFNPLGTQKSDTANNLAHAQLTSVLTDLGLESIEGSGSEVGTQWPAEKSLFALGLSREGAISIGRQFDQDAIVWVGDSAVPELVLLR